MYLYPAYIGTSDLQHAKFVRKYVYNYNSSLQGSSKALNISTVPLLFSSKIILRASLILCVLGESDYH